MSDLMNPAKPEIKNIIFDLGGVLLNIDPRITGRRLEEFGVVNMEELHHKLMDVRLYKRFDSGACSPERFYEEIRELSGISLTDNQIEEAWNALLLDFPTKGLICCINFLKITGCSCCRTPIPSITGLTRRNSGRSTARRCLPFSKSCFFI
jgi:FMN phosphatase YigB (HAD superfamily)